MWLYITPLINVYYNEIDFYSSFILFPLSFICEVNNIPIICQKVWSLFEGLNGVVPFTVIG